MENVARLTPLMEQYVNIKKQHHDEVLFFRVGDFYEMFFDDAVEVSRLLNLTLTHRGEHPMCGVPYHASKVYISRLLRIGKKVAICEQVGEIATGGGLTERKVVEIITPGTVVDSEYLDQSVNNYLASICVFHGKVAFAYIDVTTSDFRVTSWNISSFEENLSKELGRCSPKELLLPLSLKENQVVKNNLSQNPSIVVSYYPDWNFNIDSSYKKLIEQFKVANLKSFGLTEQSAEVIPAGFLIEYLAKTTSVQIPHVKNIKVYYDSEYVVIDDSSRRNLEIIYNLRDGSTKYSLLECVNYTLTSMGNRLIRNWLLSPLCDIKQIQIRQNHVEYFFKNKNILKSVRDGLSSILDIQRLSGRIAMDRAHAKDLQALRVSIDSWVNIRNQLDSFDLGFNTNPKNDRVKALSKACLDRTYLGFNTNPKNGRVKALSKACLDRTYLALVSLDDAKFVSDLIFKSINEDPATSLTEGRLIKRGWSSELDHYYEIQLNFNKILDEYLEEEKNNTGIQNLKIKHSSATGYVIEVTKGKLGSVPEHFIMRRSLMNAERYTTEKLQQLEQELNSASSKIIETEKTLFLEVRTKLQEFVPYLMELSNEVAYFDTIASYAQAANLNRWIKPEITDTYELNIQNARHPVVEKYLPSGEFVPNPIDISANENEISFGLITGPNMAGKSTYLRQCALITLLAQTGSFVPADKATIGLVDKIFCRVGASDNLARGESTFLVEMSETALILKSSTKRSLVIMDEVGRGTSTEDGLSIACAVSEFLLNTLKCRTLFATHYHELTRLEHKNLKLLCMEVKESGDSVIFLRKITEGAAENSYGIHVASLAGIPKEIVDRAKDILENIQNKAKDNPLMLMSNEKTPKHNSIEQKDEYQESCLQKNELSQKTFVAPGLFSDEEIILDEILSCDLDNITPLNALSLISRWKKSLSGR